MGMVARFISLMNKTTDLIRRMVRSTGFDVVRITIPHEKRGPEPAAGATGPGSKNEFFPTDASPRRFKLWPVPPDLANRTERWARVLAEMHTRPASWPACVSPETGMLIHALVRNLRPRVVVETGTCHGASMLWIAAAMQMSASEGAEPGVIHTFDNYLPPRAEWLANMPLYKDRETKVRRRFERCGFGAMIRIHVGDSASNVAAARPELDRAGGVQLAFIDGDHTDAGVQRDFVAVEPSLNLGGYVLLHDVFPSICNWSGPRKLADRINTFAAGKYQMCDIYTAPLNYGVTVLRRVE